MSAAPSLETIGGRIKAERLRLGLSQPAFAALARSTKGGLVKWENNTASPNAVALASFSNAGADVLFIVTGRREISSASEPLAGVTVRQAFAMLAPADRHRLLLDLLADELRA